MTIGQIIALVLGLILGFLGIFFFGGASSKSDDLRGEQLLSSAILLAAGGLVLAGALLRPPTVAYIEVPDFDGDGAYQQAERVSSGTCPSGWKYLGRRGTAAVCSK